MKKIGGIINKKINAVKETDTNKNTDGAGTRLPPGSPVFRRVQDELKTGNNSTKKKYVNFDDRTNTVHIEK